MLITRISPFDGVKRSIELPITEEQYLAWDNGELIQVAMPDLTLEQREFLITGLTPKCWVEGVCRDRLPTFDDLVFEQDLYYPHHQLGEQPRMLARWKSHEMTLSVGYGGSHYGCGPKSDQYEVAVYTGVIEEGNHKFIPLQEHDDVMGWASSDYITQLMQIIAGDPKSVLDGALLNNACFSNS